MGSWYFGEYPSNWSQISEKCIARDGYRCVNCGQHRGGRYRLNAHHITPVTARGGHDLSNLITLCEACHIYFHPHLQRISGITPKSPSETYYRTIRSGKHRSEKLKNIPQKSLPLKRVDIDYNKLSDANLMEIYANMYGGYADIKTFAGRKVWLIYISKKENKNQVKELFGINVAGLILTKNNLAEEIASLNKKRRVLRMNRAKLKKKEKNLKIEISSLEKTKTDFNRELNELKERNEYLRDRIPQFIEYKGSLDSDIQLLVSLTKEVRENNSIYRWFKNRFYIMGSIALLLMIIFIETAMLT